MPFAYSGFVDHPFRLALIAALVLTSLGPMSASGHELTFDSQDSAPQSGCSNEHRPRASQHHRLHQGLAQPVLTGASIR